MFNHLEQSIDLLKNDKNIILERWMDYDIIGEILTKHGFEVNFFAKNFGSKVIDYTLDVIVQKENIGDCPVIGILLIMFKKRNIPLSDLFLICMHLKNSFIDYLLEKKILNHYTLLEINKVMDYNFEGIIKEYMNNHNENSLIVEVKNRGNGVTVCKKEEVYTTTASTFINEVDIDLELIHELDDLEDEVFSLIEYHQTFNVNLKEKSILLLTKYNRALQTLFEFKELSYALTLLAKVLDETVVEDIDSQLKQNIVIYLKSFILDLVNWRMSVFIKQDIDDIHYLDKTLLSSAAQLEIMLMPQTADCDDGIDFF